jgi:hypothetical protein
VDDKPIDQMIKDVKKKQKEVDEVMSSKLKDGKLSIIFVAKEKEIAKDKDSQLITNYSKKEEIIKPQNQKLKNCHNNSQLKTN